MLRVMDINHMPPYFSWDERQFFRELYERSCDPKRGIIGLIPPAPGKMTVYIVVPSDRNKEIPEEVKRYIDDCVFKVLPSIRPFRTEIIRVEELASFVGVIYGDYEIIKDCFPNYMNKYLIEFRPPRKNSAQNQPGRILFGRPFGF